MGTSGALRPSSEPLLGRQGGEHPFYRWLLMEGTKAGDVPPRCASPRYFPKDFLILPRRQLRPPEVARILMEAAGRDP